MRGAVLKEIFRQSWMQMLYWGLGLGLMGFFVVILVPDAAGLQAMKDFLARMPPFLLQAVGVGDDINYMASPEGFITIGFFGKTLTLLAVYPIIMGLRVTIFEEDNGTLDMLLSLPVPRWQVLVEKFLAYTVTLVVIAAMIFAGLGVGALMVDYDLDIGRLAVTSLNILPSMLLILAFTILVGAVIRGKKMAIGISAAFVMGSFMLNTIGEMARGSFAENLRLISFFSYYDSTSVMKHGIVWGNVGLLLVVAALMLGASLWFFQRRDVGI